MASIRPLSSSLELKAKEELNEVPDRVASDIEAIREWLKKQPHLASVNPTDQWIVTFLRGNKFSLERTKEKLDMYYTLRTVVPEIYHNKDPFDPVIQDILKLGWSHSYQVNPDLMTIGPTGTYDGIYLPIPRTENEDDCRNILIRFDGRTSKYNLLDIIKVFYMIIEILIVEDDNYIVAGLEELVDIEGASLSVFMQFTPVVAKKIITSAEKGLPFRFKGCHIFNSPPGIETTLSLVRSVLSAKLKQRFFVHTKMDDSVYNIFSKKVLPREYGGENGTVQDLVDYWKTKVESYRDWFLLQEEQRSDESLRLGEPKTTSNLFGIEGSFRKLEVD